MLSSLDSIAQNPPDKNLLLDIFSSKEWDVSKAKIKAWVQKTGSFSCSYREMPREALDDFIKELYKRKSVPTKAIKR